eukprot:m.174945 g.174945  ORF g.174945 m.174945 type:complete len:443 (-) comp14599_c0_seq3:564-1892(-)
MQRFVLPLRLLVSASLSRTHLSRPFVFGFASGTSLVALESAFRDTNNLAFPLTSTAIRTMSRLFHTATDSASALVTPLLPKALCDGDASASTLSGLPVPVTMAQMLLPDDANPAGQVHGGVILRLIDQAAFAAATKYFNQGRESDSPPGVAALAHIDQVNFHKPIQIGEVAEVIAHVTYTSEHSIEVSVHVYAENPLTGVKRLTNTARTWYVVKQFSAESFMRRVGRRTEAMTKFPTLSVPQLDVVAQQPKDDGRARYTNLKADRKLEAEAASTEAAKREVDAQQPTLIHVLLPSDCFSNGVAQAGAIMKLMDTAAGVVAFRHCRSNVVTASLESMDFKVPAFNGSLVEVYAKPIFTSSRSMDIEVIVITQDSLSGSRDIATSSIFTFVALDENRRPKTIEPITPTTDEEKRKFAKRQAKYEQRKIQRQAAKAVAAGAGSKP